MLFLASLDLVVRYILCVVPFLGSDSTLHFCGIYWLSNLVVTRGDGEHGRNFWCNFGAI